STVAHRRDAKVFPKPATAGRGASLSRSHGFGRADIRKVRCQGGIKRERRRSRQESGALCWWPWHESWPSPSGDTWRLAPCRRASNWTPKPSPDGGTEQFQTLARV